MPASTWWVPHSRTYGAPLVNFRAPLDNCPYACGRGSSRLSKVTSTPAQRTGFGEKTKAYLGLIDSTRPVRSRKEKLLISALGVVVGGIFCAFLSPDWGAPIIGVSLVNPIYEWWQDRGAQVDHTGTHKTAPIRRDWVPLAETFGVNGVEQISRSTVHNDG